MKDSRGIAEEQVLSFEILKGCPLRSCVGQDMIRQTAAFSSYAEPMDNLRLARGIDVCSPG